MRSIKNYAGFKTKMKTFFKNWYSSFGLASEKFPDVDAVVGAIENNTIDVDEFQTQVSSRNHRIMEVFLGLYNLYSKDGNKGIVINSLFADQSELHPEAVLEYFEDKSDTLLFLTAAEHALVNNIIDRNANSLEDARAFKTLIDNKKLNPQLLRFANRDILTFLLQDACQRKDWESILNFIKAGADFGGLELNATYSSKYNFKANMPILYAALAEGQRGVVQEFLNRMTAEELDEMRFERVRPYPLLHWIVRYCDPEYLTMFLEKGCDVNVRDNDGNTPLIFISSNQSMFNPYADLKCVQILLNRSNIDVNALNNLNETALFASAAYRSFLPNMRSLLAQGADVNIKSRGLTALGYATLCDNIEGMQTLIGMGADVKIPDGKGNTPLHAVRSVEAAQLLIDAGADVSIQNKEGHTPALEKFRGELRSNQGCVGSPAEQKSEPQPIAQPVIHGLDNVINPFIRKGPEDRGMGAGMPK